MNKKAKKIWDDPVWSKVIAFVICAILTVLYNLSTAIFNGKTFISEFLSFWSFQISLWVYALFSLLIIVIYWLNFRIRTRRSATTTHPVVNEPKAKVLFDSAKANKLWFVGSGENHWKEDKPVGNQAEGSWKYDNGILEIERQNTDGRYVIKIMKYLSNGGSTDYVKMSMDQTSYRTIQIQFSSRILVGSHVLWFIAKKANNVQWIHDANVRQQISSESWKEFNIHFRIPSNVDFDIHIDDREVVKAPSIVMIKDLIIQEVLSN